MTFICQHCGKENAHALKFKKPAIGDVGVYGIEIGISVHDAEAFFDYQESKGWKIGNSPMKDWKAALRTWKRNGEKFGRSSAQSKGAVIEDNHWRDKFRDNLRAIQSGDTDWPHHRKHFAKALEAAPSLDSLLAWLQREGLSAEQIQELQK